MSRLLRAALPPTAPIASWPGLDAWWEQASAAAKSRCPGLELDAQPVVAGLALRLRALPVRDVEKLAADDVLIVEAALQGDRGALAEVDRRLVLAAQQALRPMRIAEAELDEVTQQTRARLLVRGADGGPRLATFTGRGPLDAWLRAVVARQALAARRRDAPSATLSSTVVHDGPGAESKLRDAEHALAVRDALEKAFAALTSRQRTLLRLHGLDNLSLASIGAMYGKDASTISRWLQSAREAVRAEASRLVGRQLGLDTSGADSLLRAAGVSTDATLDRLLAGSSSSAGSSSGPTKS